MQQKHSHIAIIGAGPCGLGAAWRLQELGHTDYTIHEQHDYVGGLSASFVDDHGFTWDIGGHVLFSHYDYFDRVMQAVMPRDRWLDHVRESWIWMCGRFLPYPLQYNIGRLPEKEMLECLAGLIRCRQNPALNQHNNFLEWIDRFFGDGIAKHFLIPYNKKVWAYPPEDLNATWIGERVAVPDLDRILDNILTGKDDCSWGPNNTFSFPLHGGTGAIWRSLADHLPPDKINLNKKLTGWDASRKTLSFADGSQTDYDYLISTIPLDQLLSLGTETGMSKPAPSLYSTSHIIGVGLSGAAPEKLRTKCWMYFPEADNPFYRVTVFSNYSYNNVPGDNYWSLMGEISESPKKPVDRSRLLDSALEGFRATGLIAATDTIESTWTFSAQYAYPTPFLNRDAVLGACLPPLKELGVYSRGRFGAWKYECANMDHVFMQGVEAVENILFATPEITLNHPSLVNSHKIR